jgi:hypothetical protein
VKEEGPDPPIVFEVAQLVNELLKKDIELIEAAR